MWYYSLPSRGMELISPHQNPLFHSEKKNIYIYIYIYLATKRKKVYKTGILRTSKPSPKINPKPFMILCSNSSLA